MRTDFEGHGSGHLRPPDRGGVPLMVHPSIACARTRQDLRWLMAAIKVSRLSPPATDHYAVGAVVESAEGHTLATGYTGETDPHYHAEEAALAKLEGVDLRREQRRHRNQRPHPREGFTGSIAGAERRPAPIRCRGN